ncbi:hypothetical protein FEC33_19025, partial [Acinetobacter baumannii]
MAIVFSGTSVLEDDAPPSSDVDSGVFLRPLFFDTDGLVGLTAPESLASAERIEPAIGERLSSTGIPLPVAQPPSSWQLLPPP